MASPRTRRVLKDLRLKNGNNMCFECGTHNPQWASASYGLWICLECSGKHRSLGVHLSFVRSITMDKWKDSELEKMKAGGNNTSREFLKSQPDYDPNWTFQEKYNSKAAALLRDKVLTEAEGKPWSIETSKARNHVPYVAKMTSNTLKTSHNSAIHHSSSSPNFSKGSGSSSGVGYNAGGAMLSGSGHGSDDWNMDYGMSKSEISRQKEDFFDKKKSENANRPDDLPPSQGGKYSGFGYSVPKEESQSSQAMDNAVASLSQGWASFSVGASKFLSATKDNAMKFSSVASQRTQETFTKVNEKVHDGKLLTDISAGTKSLASKVAANTQKGWTDFTKMFGENPSLDDESTKPKTDTPLMGDPVAREHKEKLRSPDTGAADDDWGWGVAEDDWTEDKEAEKKLEADDDDGWGSWGNEGSGGGALIDFGDDDSTPVADTKPKSSSKPTSSKSSKKSSSSKSSSSSRTTKSSSTTKSPDPINSGKPISSLEETWDDAGGWDDAAWDEVETDSRSKKD